MVETKAAELALKDDRPGSTLGLVISPVEQNGGTAETSYYFRRRKNSRSNQITSGASNTGNNCAILMTNAGINLKDSKIEVSDCNYVDLTVDSPHSNGKTLASSVETASPELSFLRRHHRSSYRRPRTVPAMRTSSLRSPAEAEVWIVGSEAEKTSDMRSGFRTLQEATNDVSCNNNGAYVHRKEASNLDNAGGSLGASRAGSMSKESKQKESIPSGISKQVGGCSSSHLEHVQGWKRKRSSLTDPGTSSQRFKPPRNVWACSTSGSLRGGVELPIEIDILESPSNSATAENSAPASPNRAKQIEEDELLAKFLQEDFGMEDSRGNFVLDDADFARMLQEEENTRYMQGRVTSSSQANNVSVMRAASREMQRVLPTIRSQPRPASSSRMRILRNLHNRSRQHAARGIRRGGSAMDSSEHLLHFPEELDLETRVELLAALETVSQGSLTMLDHVDREFNEGDYEMLLALDDNNHGCGGASYNKIEQLPISVIKPTDVYQEICSICLEIPVVDNVVRRLPCMHGFHLQCIDEWLGRQPTCPICKMKI